MPNFTPQDFGLYLKVPHLVVPSTAYVYSGVGTFPYLMMLVIAIYLKSTFLIAGANSKMPHKYHIGILYLHSVLEYIDS